MRTQADFLVFCEGMGGGFKFFFQLSVLFTIVSLHQHVFAWVPCPLGPKETELTVSRVMRNFGRYLMTAESAALKGSQNPDWVTEDELAKSIADLEVVIACGEESIKSSTQALIPVKARYMEAVEREAYMAEYQSRMKIFVFQVRNFKKSFEELRDQQPSRRQYTSIYNDSKLMNAHIDNSHRELSCWQSLVTKAN